MKFLFIAVFFVGSNLSHAAVRDFPSVSEHVDMALTANAVAESYEQWQVEGLTPEFVFKVAHEKRSPQAWLELCHKLSRLSLENLAFFEEEFTHGQFAAEIPCAPTLKQKLSRFWEKGKQILAEKAGNKKHISVSEAPPAPTHPRLPSVIKELDTTTGPILFDGGLKRGEIALTIDDGPHPTRTTRILNTLKTWGVRATFFCVGENAQRWPRFVQAEVIDGHSVGSHSWNHANLPSLDPSQAEHNILRGHDAVMTAAGLETPFFRFPYGAQNSHLRNFIAGLKMGNFMWNMDSSDWRIRNPSALFDNVVNLLDTHKGGIILFHDIQEQTAIIMPHVLEELHKRHFTTVVFLPRLDTQLAAGTK